MSCARFNGTTRESFRKSSALALRDRHLPNLILRHLYDGACTNADAVNEFAPALLNGFPFDKTTRHSLDGRSARKFVSLLRA